MPERTPEFFQPFYIAAGAGAIGAITKVRATARNLKSGKGVLELQVVAGGPVFLWKGEKSVQAAYDASRGSRVDFDLACAKAGKAEIDVDNSMGLLTLHSDVESIGYIRLKSVN